MLYALAKLSITYLISVVIILIRALSLVCVVGRGRCKLNSFHCGNRSGIRLKTRMNVDLFLIC